MGLRRHIWVPAATAMSVLVVSCSGSSRGAPLPAPPSIVKVRMANDRFIYKPPTSTGRAVFSVTNADKVNHRLTLIPIDDDVPPIDEQLHSTSRRQAQPEAQSLILHPGQAEAFAIDVVPGQRYALVCFLHEPGDPVIYALKGMNSEFRVGTRAPA